MRTALAIFVAAMLLAGCGEASAPKDPFVGTWRTVDPSGSDVHLVVAKAGASYRTILVVPHGFGWVAPYRRDGNELKVSLSVVNNGKPTGRTIVELVNYHPTTGHLTYKDGTGPAVEFSRVSSSTAVPSPSS